MGNIWIVTPVYYDVESFLKLRDNISALLPQCQFVVHDDSAGRDEEIQKLAKLPNITIIEPPYNLGHQRGLVYSLRQLRTTVAPQDLVVTMDSDGEDRPEDLPDLLESLRKLKHREHGVSLIYRTKRKESLKFKFFYFFYKNMFRLLTGHIIRSGNFAAYHGKFLHSYIDHPFFDLCYSSTLVALKVEKQVVPRPRGTRYAGQSKMNTTNLIMHGIRMLMPFLDQMAIRSLIAFAGLFGASVFVACNVLFQKFVLHTAIPGWASTILMTALLMSFMALGHFLLLFAIFSQSQGQAMNRIEQPGEVKEAPTSGRLAS